MAIPTIIEIDKWILTKPRSLRIIYDSIRVFLLEHCTIRATALAYTSLLAAVPFLILITSISISLGIGDLFVMHLPEFLPKILEKTLPYINSALHLFFVNSDIELNAMVATILDNIMPFLIKAQEIKLGSLGLIGAGGLLVTFILAIDTIETNMNIVWGVNESRGYGQKAAVFIPFLLLFAGGIGLFSVFIHNIRNVLETTLVHNLPFGKFGEMIADLSIPIILLGVLLLGLWLLYCYMPFVPEKDSFWHAFKKKTRRRGVPALISAVFAFIGICIFSTAMGFLQAGMFAKWSLFYGSLAFLPMLMFLLFGLWSIVLFGNALCWRITERHHDNKYFASRISDAYI